MVNSKKGFTLAEILITLLIIGVVSSIVIPSLINDTQDVEFRAAWKKTYSSVNQAYKQILIDNGGTFINAANDSLELRELFKNKMNYVATCNNTSCAASSLKQLNGDSDSYSFDYNLVLSDGTIMRATLNRSNCSHSGYVYSDARECGYIFVDVNGKKGPNQWGKDVYGIWIIKNQILPWGANPVGTGWSQWGESTCSASDTGYGCGSKYLYN